MRTLRDAAIKQKLVALIMVTNATALVLAGVAIVITDSVLFRVTMRRDLTALASILADTTTTALTSGDPRAAIETLAALKARPHLIAACIDRADGTIFAGYSRPGADRGCPPPAASQGVQFGVRDVTVMRRIELGGRTIGAVVLLYDLDELTERIRLYAVIVLAIALVSGLIAFLLSSQLRTVIVTPISRLAGAAASISESGDYGIRVQKDSADELGVLVDSFNVMLERIQSRDAEIQNARNLLHTTLSSIGDAVISTDREGRVVFCNRVACTLVRWPDSEVAGRHIDEVFHIINEFTRARVESPVATVLREGAIVGLANHTLLIARDGTEIPIDDSAAPIQQEGKTIGVVLVFRDISERRRGQRDAAYLASIVESTDDAVIGKSLEGIIQSWNPGAERLFGYRADEVVGHAMLEFVPPERKQEEFDILERLRMGKSVLHFETVRMRKDGAAVDVSLSISPIRDKTGQVVGISHVARDITAEKKNAEQMRQTQKLESLGVLAGGIAHDFNNLLTGILGNASLALDDLAPGSPAAASVAAVIEASERAAQLSRQMLAYSGRGHFVLELVDLSARIRETLPLIKAAVPPAVEIRLDLEPNLPAIEADPAQMQQLIMNIIINAAEAVPEGKPGRVTITSRSVQIDGRSLPPHQDVGMGELTPGPFVMFEVSDTGVGMDEDTKSRIFDPFFTTKFTGRGLGLAAVLGIVRGHRGSIRVSSALGKGTTFRILFPAVQGAASSQAQPREQAAADLHGSGVVLVIDDEQIVRDMAKNAVERSGYSVLLAEDGARGLDIFRREKDCIRCVLLDLTMPVMSGEETLSRIQALDRDIPVILSSGFNEVQAMRRFQGKGLAGFLQKPYKPEELVQKIHSVMADSAARVSRKRS
jgi:two-component system, cell cycle sensor histidine kinase and response regulator CckA